MCLHTALIDLAGGFMRFTSEELDASVEVAGCCLDALRGTPAPFGGGDGGP